MTALQKTIVLLVSILYFNSPPRQPLMVWLGVFMQLIGSLIYARVSTFNVNADALMTNPLTQSSKDLEDEEEVKITFISIHSKLRFTNSVLTQY